MTKLEELIECARLHIPTNAEKRAQVISFAYGNLAIKRPEVTRAEVEAAYNKLFPKEAE